MVAVIGGGVWAWKIHERDQATIAQTQGALQAKEEELKARDVAYVTLQQEKQELADSLRTESKKNEAFAEEIARISGTVGVLEKLSKTDPELLKRYSKIYFLNENYIPRRLSDIPSEYVSSAAVRTPLTFHAEALPYLESMLDAAKDDRVDLQVISAYRSFGTQAQLKSSYKVKYGSGANTFSADQGYSEHQLGTTVDLTTSKIGGTFTGFDKTPAYTWLKDNAQRYGFVLSYPPGNAAYQFEPWHWRFVGRDLAKDLKADGKWFYEMDQRTLEGYLPALFD